MKRHANRTYLFTPATHPRRVEKAFNLDADAVILDLEDAVAITEKVAAREKVNEFLNVPRKPAAYVRVNAYDTEFCHGDIQAITSQNLDGIVLPKLETVAELKSIDWLLSNLERECGMAAGSVDLMPIIETAKGAVNLRKIVAAGSRIRRISFGAGDYTRDLGMEWSLGEEELLAIRSEVVIASRYGDLEPPIDTVFIQIKQHEAFHASCTLVRGLGFQGKFCIHPDQVPVANDVFTPTQDDVAWSEKIVAAFVEAENQGVASIQVDGYFVDYPIVEKARRTINTARLLAEIGT
ncbi:MAG: CoA ester lyase [Rhodospirillaceae bacterium]|nr:CoA ester lyase [Rhodospirillaceae bacterium]